MQARTPQGDTPSWALDPTFAPMLRVDVRVVPHGNCVRIYENSMHRFVEMSRIDCRIAQLMDGTRGLDELFAIGTALHSLFTRATLECLVVNLNTAGLLRRVETF